MKLPKRHAPTVFLVVMVGIMVLVMSLVLGLLNGAYRDAFWLVWARQAAIAYVVALPAAFVARRIATIVVARAVE